MCDLESKSCRPYGARIAWVPSPSTSVLGYPIPRLRRCETVSSRYLCFFEKTRPSARKQKPRLATGLGSTVWQLATSEWWGAAPGAWVVLAVAAVLGC